jgi:ABC-2 type transport system permease protein
VKKYWQIIKITFEEYFEYRLNFVLWRFRSFVSFLTLFFFWLAVFGPRKELLNYQKSQLLTYVVGVAFLRSIVLASRSVDLSGQIRSGELTKLIMRPLGMLQYWFSRDLADKVLNIFFTIFEIGLILAIFKFPLYFPKNQVTYFWFLLFVILGVFLYFFISFTIAVVTFWVDEIWATRWLFGIIFLEFFSGAFFPIDILPNWLTKIIYLTPFPYLVFSPLKIWLEQLSGFMIIKVVLVCLVWLIFFWRLSLFLWEKGAKNYGAYGG